MRTISVLAAALVPATVAAIEPGPHRVPTVEAALARGSTASAALSTTAAVGIAPSEQLAHGGGVASAGITKGPPAVYLVFWGSQWGAETPTGSAQFSNDPSGVGPRLVAMFSGIGTGGETWSGVMTQYCDGIEPEATVCPLTAPHVGYPLGGALAGVWGDGVAPAPAAAFPQQVADEAVRAAGHFGNTTPESNRNAQYVVVSPTGTRPDGFPSGFCAWHDDTRRGFDASPYGDIAFTNLPYIPDAGASCGANFVNAGPAGILDGVTIVEGHEYAETITDQVPGVGWTDRFGLENADKCVWITTGPGRVQNVTFTTGTFPMQSTWSNDGSTCLIAHPIFGATGLPDDFAMDLNPPAGFVMPGGTASTVIETATLSGAQQTLALSVDGVPPDATVTLPSPTLAADDTETITIATSDTTPYGIYPITISAVGSTTHTATYTFVVTSPPVPLENEVAVTNLAGDAGSEQLFEFDVPLLDLRNQPWFVVDFTIDPTTGDAVVYASRETVPADDDYECRGRDLGPCLWRALAHSLDGGNSVPAARWYVRVHGASAFSGLALKATYTSLAPVGDRARFRNMPGTPGLQRFWQMDVPPGLKALKLNAGNSAVYVRQGGLPSQFATACPPAVPDLLPKRCLVTNPSPGTWYVGLYFTKATTHGRLSVRYIPLK